MAADEYELLEKDVIKGFYINSIKRELGTAPSYGEGFSDSSHRWKYNNFMGYHPTYNCYTFNNISIFE